MRCQCVGPESPRLRRHSKFLFKRTGREKRSIEDPCKDNTEGHTKRRRRPAEDERALQHKRADRAIPVRKESAQDKRRLPAGIEMGGNFRRETKGPSRVYHKPSKGKHTQTSFDERIKDIKLKEREREREREREKKPRDREIRKRKKKKFSESRLSPLCTLYPYVQYMRACI